MYLRLNVTLKWLLEKSVSLCSWKVLSKDITGWDQQSLQSYNHTGFYRLFFSSHLRSYNHPFYVNANLPPFIFGITQNCPLETNLWVKNVWSSKKLQKEFCLSYIARTVQMTLPVTTLETIMGTVTLWSNCNSNLPGKSMYSRCSSVTLQ